MTSGSAQEPSRYGQTLYQAGQWGNEKVSVSPRFVSAAGPAFGVATVLLITYFAATKWLVSLGHAVSPTLLLGQLAVYPALVVGSLVLIRWLGCKWPFAGRKRLQWVSVISVGAAIALLVIRFFWKHPVSEWGGISPQGWRDIWKDISSGD